MMNEAQRRRAVRQGLRATTGFPLAADCYQVRQLGRLPCGVQRFAQVCHDHFTAEASK